MTFCSPEDFSPISCPIKIKYIFSQHIMVVGGTEWETDGSFAALKYIDVYNLNQGYNGVWTRLTDAKFLLPVPSSQVVALYANPFVDIND